MGEETQFIRGGSFLIDDLTAAQIFTPEDFNEEQHMMAKTTEEFVVNEIVPVLEEIENHNFDHTVRVFKEAGKLGLLGAEVPEKYGGLGLDKISTSLIAENFALARSLAVSFGAHVGIGTLPIVFFGTEEQKQKYLPGLASGETIAAYALTEPTSGSDALSAKTVAKKSDDGQHYILTGQKQWITNSAYAGVFIVYAKIDGEQFTAFIVDRDSEGLSTGAEEKKMGIRGSSTRTLILDDVKVPVENVLGEIGKGHIIAFNILNIGRYKLAVGCVGSAKRAIELSVKYAKERKQFNTPIANFNLIKSKLANMAMKTYVLESMVYRTGGLFEDNMGQLTDEELEGSEVAKSIAEYAIECSINKVFGSEVLDHVVDEAVQIYGGYGFMSEYEVENLYRDSRINRIFEGTNEINRLLIPGTLIRKTMKGELGLLSAASGLQDELMAYMPMEPDPDDLLAKEKQHLEIGKKILLMVAGTGVEKFQEDLEKEQEILAHIADMVTEVFAMESAILRTEKAVASNGEEKEAQKIDYTRVYCQDSIQRIESCARESLAAMEEGDMLRTMLSILRKLTRYNPINSVEAKRDIADRMIEENGYVV